MKYFSFLLIFLIAYAGCDKMEEKKDSVQTPPSNLEKPSQTTTDKKSSTEEKSGDEVAQTLQNVAEDAETKYKNEQSPENKKTLVDAHLKAGNYLMFEADLPAKQKYRPALKHFRRVLELNPDNSVAAKNKKQIEDIYESMGMPIPQ